MKHITYFYKYIFVAFILLSCKKNNSDSTPNPISITSTGTSSATVSGSAYTGTSSKAVLSKLVITGKTTYTLYLESKNASTNKLLTFNIRSQTVPTTGNYSITIANSNDGYFYENKDLSNEKVWAAPKYSNSDLNKSYGSINITELTDNKAKGTFNFTTYTLSGAIGADTVRIVTNGIFDVPMTKQGF